jgi:dTDP-4-dehydrorhamnose 3,5-epimerase
MKMNFIKDVKVKRLKYNCDERGRLIEIFRNDDEEFEKFGQFYMTTAYPKVVKGWHYHKLQDDYFFVAKGMAKIVLCDWREDSPTYKKVNEFFMGEFNPVLLKIPKGVLHGFKCISEEECLIFNCPTMAYNRENPDEFRLPAHTDEVPYDWERKDG